MKILLSLLLVLCAANRIDAQTLSSAAGQSTDSCAYIRYGGYFEDMIRGGKGHDTLFVENPYNFSVRIDSITVTPPYTLEHFPKTPFMLGALSGLSGAINILIPDTASADYDLTGDIHIYTHSDSADCVPSVKPVKLHVLAHDNTNGLLGFHGVTIAQAHLDSRTDTRRLTLFNNDQYSIQIDSVVANSYWSLISRPSMPRQLRPGDTLSVDVHFSAPGDGMYRGGIAVYDNNYHTYGVELWYVVKAVASVSTLIRSEQSLRITPNPSTGEATLHIAAPEAGIARLTIYDGLGRVVLARNAELTTGENALTLETASLPSGTYNCIVRASNLDASARLLIVR